MRFWGMVEEAPRPPPPSGSCTSSISVAIITWTSRAILPSVAQTSARKLPTSAKPSCMVCQAIAGWASPSRSQSPFCTSSPLSPSEFSAPTAPPNALTSTRGFSWASRSRWRSIPDSQTAAL